MGYFSILEMLRYPLLLQQQQKLSMQHLGKNLWLRFVWKKLLPMEVSHDTGCFFREESKDCQGVVWRGNHAVNQLQWCLHTGISGFIQCSHRREGGWVGVHVLEHVLRHMPKQVLEHESMYVLKHVLRHMPDKHMLEYAMTSTLDFFLKYILFSP